MRIGIRILAGVFLAWMTTAGIASATADEVDDLFSTPAADAPPAVPDNGGSLLAAYQKSQEKIAFSFDLSAGGGFYAGYRVTPDLADTSRNFTHNSFGGLTISPSIDVRPFDYFRLHGSGTILYPTVTSGNYAFGASLNELFFDYSAPGLLALRMGRFSTGWGNARILGIADLSNRTVDTTNLDSSISILPAWLQATQPSLWLKTTFPIGGIGFTGLVGLPANDSEGISSLGYGLLTELVKNKTCVSLAGYYKSDRTPRLAFMVKTSVKRLDLFLDTTTSFPTSGDPLLNAVGGLYWQASSGPDLKITAELKWNGENPTGSTTLVPDPIVIGGLSNALAFSWSDIGGSALSIGGTWYHSWVDNSGALCPYVDIDLGRLASIKMVFPWVYGADGSLYRSSPPGEAGGYVFGAGFVLALKTSF